MNDKPFETVRDVMTKLTAYLPTFLAGLLVLVLGAIVAWIVSKLVVRVLLLLRVHRVVARLGWGRSLEKGDVRHSLFGFLGGICGVVLFLVFLENAVVIWKLTVLSKLLEKLVMLIPQLITAVIVLLIGWGVATAASRAAQRTLAQEEFQHARLAARVVHIAILVVACAIALVELDVAVTIVTGAFLIGFGALALSFAIAFGLGSKQAVEFMWKERFRKNREEREKPHEPSREK